MKKLFLYVSVLIGMMVLVSGCNTKDSEGMKPEDTTEVEYQTNSNLTSVENLLENNPELQESFDEISWDVQEKLLLPSVDTIPFEVEETSIFSYQKRPSVDVYYEGEGMFFTASLWYYDGDLSEGDEEVELEKGITGTLSYIDSPQDSILVTWQDQEKGSNLLYSAHLANEEGGAEEATIQLANSMIASEAHTYVNQEEGYQESEDDIVLKNEQILTNKEILENFMEVAGKENEPSIRIVKHVLGRGAVVYDLESKYDEHAKQGWIEVTPNLTHYTPLEDDHYEVFNQAPQQCGDLTKDEVEGFYMLHECRTHLNYELLPIVEDE